MKAVNAMAGAWFLSRCHVITLDSMSVAVNAMAGAWFLSRPVVHAWRERELSLNAMAGAWFLSHGSPWDQALVLAAVNAMAGAWFLSRTGCVATESSILKGESNMTKEELKTLVCHAIDGGEIEVKLGVSGSSTRYRFDLYAGWRSRSSGSDPWWTCSVSMSNWESGRIIPMVHEWSGEGMAMRTAVGTWIRVPDDVPEGRVVSWTVKEVTP